MPRRTHLRARNMRPRRLQPRGKVRDWTRTDGGYDVVLDGAVDRTVVRQEPVVREIGRNGKPLKRPVTELREVESIERQSGVVTRRVLRRKSLRKLLGYRK